MCSKWVPNRIIDAEGGRKPLDKHLGHMLPNYRSWDVFVIVLEAQDGQLHLTTNDLDVGVSAQVSAEVEVAGSTTLPARRLVNIVKELPASDIEIEVAESECRIDTYRASGAGGQHVNTTDSAVRITHLPTGMIVTQSQKSQHRNRDEAMRVLRARLYEKARDEANAERAANRKGQVGSGDRSERIRTYNYPQGRVSDHRINLTLHKLDRIVAGDGLGEVMEALTAEDQAARLAELGE